MKMPIRMRIGLAAMAAALSMSALAAWTPAERLPQPQPEGYVLRAYCGRVAIYMPNGAQPVETTDIELKNLPSADQRELKTGIFIEDMEQLALILEDLGS